MDKEELQDFFFFLLDSPAEIPVTNDDNESCYWYGLTSILRFRDASEEFSRNMIKRFNWDKLCEAKKMAFGDDALEMYAVSLKILLRILIYRSYSSAYMDPFNKLTAYVQTLICVALNPELCDSVHISKKLAEEFVKTGVSDKLKKAWCDAEFLYTADLPENKNACVSQAALYDLDAFYDSTNSLSLYRRLEKTKYTFMCNYHKHIKLKSFLSLVPWLSMGMLDDGCEPKHIIRLLELDRIIVDKILIPGILNYNYINFAINYKD